MAGHRCGPSTKPLLGFLVVEAGGEGEVRLLSVMLFFRARGGAENARVVGLP
jgi:hypothetical protein